MTPINYAELAVYVIVLLGALAGLLWITVKELR